MTRFDAPFVPRRATAGRICIITFPGSAPLCPCALLIRKMPAFCSRIFSPSLKTFVLLCGLRGESKSILQPNHRRGIGAPRGGTSLTHSGSAPLRPTCIPSALRVSLRLGVVRSRWASWSSKPVAGRVAGRGGFDSHPLSPAFGRQTADHVVCCLSSVVS